MASPLLAQSTLVWSDEFDGTSIDSTNWEHMIGDGTAYGLPKGWGNGELEYYTDRPENSFVADGQLHIVAREEPYEGQEYTSARLRSRYLRDFRYGRLEAKIKLPTGQGIWSAFWMMPTNAVYGGWAASGEIDIVESVNAATRIYGTIHYGASWPANVGSGGDYADGTDFSEDFHIYAIEWTPDQMRWYVDDIWYHTELSSSWYTTAAPTNNRAPFDRLFHFLLNVAVGGAWPGPPGPSTQFPQEMVVDWVRVYAEGPQSPFWGDPGVVPGRIEAEDFDYGGEAIAYHDCTIGNSGGVYRAQTDVDIQVCSEGGYNVGWLCAGEWLEYTVDVKLSGAYVIEARVASNSTGGDLHIEFDGTDLTGAIEVPVTGGWQNWATAAATADLSSGEQVMRFVNDGGALDTYNVNYFNLYKLGDLDSDGDVDLDDYNGFTVCYTGPDGGPLSGVCDLCDFDRDGDADCEDWGQMQDTWTGPPAAPPEFKMCSGDIPTVSEWGLVVMALLVLTAGTIVLTKRRSAAA